MVRRRTYRRPVKTRRRKRNVYHFKKGVQQALHGFYTITAVFLILLVISLAFLVYQWKEYKIVEYGKDIQLLKVQILNLNSQVSRNQARINSELLKYNRIARVAGEKLNLQPSIGAPRLLQVDKDRLDYYVAKDRKIQEAQSR